MQHLHFLQALALLNSMHGRGRQTEEAVVLCVCFFSRLLCFQKITDTRWQQQNIMQGKKTQSQALQEPGDMLCSTVQTVQYMCCTFHLLTHTPRHSLLTIWDAMDSKFNYNMSCAVFYWHHRQRKPEYATMTKALSADKLFDIVSKIKYAAPLFVFFSVMKRYSKNITWERLSFPHGGLFTGKQCENRENCLITSSLISREAYIFIWKEKVVHFFYKYSSFV